MSGTNYNGMNGDWRGNNRADVLFSDEEVWLLSQIDDQQLPGQLWIGDICEQEMCCQRDMKVRGRRLWDYHKRVGDLHEILFPTLAYVLGPTSLTS